MIFTIFALVNQCYTAKINIKYDTTNNIQENFVDKRHTAGDRAWHRG